LLNAIFLAFQGELGGDKERLVKLALQRLNPADSAVAGSV
jgi:hypothetical protein